VIKRYQWIFIAITILALFFFYIEDYFKSPEKTPHYTEKVRAAKLASRAMNSLKKEMIKRNIPCDSINDPNETYLVGSKFSIISVGENSLNDVLTSLNPNFAAAIIELFYNIGLSRGDVVAINTTGSFPGLNISMLSACEIYELKPIITTAVSSASYGANIPEFTWLDMETHLKNEEILSDKTFAASIGGEKDNGEGLSPRGRELILKSIKRNGVKIINSGSLAGNIKKRFSIYNNFANQKDKNISAFIDIGGCLTTFGQTIKDTLLKPGVNRFPESQFFANYGLLSRMVEGRIPIIYLDNIQGLAYSLGLSISAVPQPEPGEDPLFHKEKYSVKLAIFFLILVVGLLFLYIRLEIYLRKK
jgi:poly-gamma-glutamate system protein